MNGYEAVDIKWETGRYGGAMGAVNGVHMFTISWGHAANPEKPYKLTCLLPGTKVWRAKSEEALRVHARTVLVEFAASILRPVASGDGPDF